MKNQKALILVIIFTLITSIFAMSDDGVNEPKVAKKEVKSVETVEDHFGVDTEMTKEEYEQFKKDYYQYQKTNRIAKGDRPFNTKINLLEIDQFKKYGIGLKKLLDMCNINDFIIRSELIIIGTYESVEIDKDMKLTYPVTFKVKVNEVIANGTEHSAIPEIITIKGFNWNVLYEMLHERTNNVVKNGGQYVLFLSRSSFYHYKKSYENGRRSTFVDDDCFAPYTFTFVGFSSRKVKNSKIPRDLNKSDLDEDYWLELDEFKKTTKEIFEINDKDNFYKRSYK